VVGGGVGGSSVSYFLRERLTESDTIDVFEQSDRIGGRVRSKRFCGHSYETGASIIHSKNKYAASFAQKFGLTKRPNSRSTLGIFDGSEFIFIENKYDFITILQLFWKYHLDLIKVPLIIESMMKDFAWIYTLQEEGISFENVGDLLKSMNIEFPLLTETSFENYLENEKGIKDKTVKQLLQSITLVNYGQSVKDLHAFVGSVAIAGAGGSLWSIYGGNQKLVENLMKASTANVHLNSTVTKIILLKNGSLAIVVNDGKLKSMVYDSVVVATPLLKNTIEFIGFPPRVQNYINSLSEMQYHTTVATLVAGKINSNFSRKGVDEILTCNSSLFFHSVSKILPVDYNRRMPSGKDIYKVFSDHQLSKNELEILFDDSSEVDIIDWKAYPHYKNLKILNELPTFMIYPGVYHVNAIEWAASAMEMSFIGGKNVALLVEKYLKI
ncbi:Prenylcysteine oxidase-like protein, partial [Dinothrombium tinctorium]